MELTEVIKNLLIIEIDCYNSRIILFITKVTSFQIKLQRVVRFQKLQSATTQIKCINQQLATFFARWRWRV